MKWKKRLDEWLGWNVEVKFAPNRVVLPKRIRNLIGNETNSTDFLSAKGIPRPMGILWPFGISTSLLPKKKQLNKNTNPSHKINHILLVNV